MTRPLDRFTLTIKLGNSAMRSRFAVADVLGDVKAKLIDGESEGSIVDVNGNVVGSFTYRYKEGDS